MSLVNSPPEKESVKNKTKESQSGANSFLSLCQQVHQRVTQYPYYTILREIPSPDDGELMSQVMQTIATVPANKNRNSLLPPYNKSERLSFTKVRVEDKAQMNNGSITRYSRSTLALPLHTDSSNKIFPQSLVAFQMVIPDSVGGESQMLTARDLIRGLSTKTIETLRQPNFPLGKHPLPIIWGKKSDPQIRYYKMQLEANQHLDKTLSIDQLDALAELDEQLVNNKSTAQFKLGRADVLIFDNTRALHGRSGLSADSQRLMYRYRIQARCLW